MIVGLHLPWCLSAYVLMWRETQAYVQGVKPHCLENSISNTGLAASMMYQPRPRHTTIRIFRQASFDRFPA
ncbi:hypothetical protein M434DRAFT_253017 [Hypoxylon sp. CO27-5]|nr:hypothetical protein M434DRAFT_253017 [Hypoxylon sp. CO27-5]